MVAAVTPAIPVLEGTVARKSLQFFWLTDCSGSMSGKKIATLNQAIREALPEVRHAVGGHPEVQVSMRAIRFADDAEWHVGPQVVPIEQFVWPELTVAGGTATSQAIRLLTSELTVERMPRRGLPPVCILVSDGYCTDPAAEYDAAIAELLKQPWGLKAVRLAIGISDGDSSYDEEQLLKFVSHPEVGVLHADTPQKLVQYIRWASVVASVGASLGRSKLGGEATGANIAFPAPPSIVPTLGAAADVW
jgi:uncharacterized protein YegL